MKFKLRRAISMALLLSIGLSGIPIVPYTAYGNTPYLGTEGGPSSGGTGQSNNSLHLIDKRQQGIRFSVVDYDGNSVVTDAYGEPLSLDVLFNQPSGVYEMTGNKLSSRYDDGRIRKIGVGEFNNLLSDAIFNESTVWDKNINRYEIKSKDEWNKYCYIPYIPRYSSSYPSGYTGLPMPVLSAGVNRWKGNGNAVKSFFVSGALGSITFTKTPTITAENILGNETPSIPTSALVKAEEKMNTPYGQVTKTWLENHISANSTKTASELYTNGHILEAEKSEIKNLLTGQESFYKFGVLNTLYEVAFAQSKDLAKSEIGTAKAELREEYMGRLWGLSRVRNGEITYEAMRAYNNGVISIYSNISTKDC